MSIDEKLGPLAYSNLKCFFLGIPIGFGATFIGNYEWNEAQKISQDIIFISVLNVTSIIYDKFNNTNLHPDILRRSPGFALGFYVGETIGSYLNY